LRTRQRALLALFLAPFLLIAATVRREPPVSPTVTRWMKSLSLREKVAQLVVIPFSGFASQSRTPEHRKFIHLIRDVRVGGLILVNIERGRLVQRPDPYALAVYLNRLQKMARLPLLVSGDFERGASMRINGVTVFPHAMAFAATGDPALTRAEGQVTARESRALGFQWIFYPDADVNDNPDNPIINIRSFGENPETVAAHAVAFIEGAQSNPGAKVLTTVKHFPGHGDTATDTHLGLATVSADTEHLHRVELAPFQAAIANGVDAVMSGHIAVPALDSPDLPSTLSAAVLTRLLRTELGFRGLVVTDALDMGGIVNTYGSGEAAVRALAAGVDVLLMPADPEAAVNAVVAAVRSGRITQKRIEQSVTRVLAAKVRVGLDRGKTVDLDAIADAIHSPEATELAQQVADRSVTLVRNQGEAVPLRQPEKTCFFVLAENRYGLQGQAFTQEVARRSPQSQIISLDSSSPEALLAAAAEQITSCDDSVVAAFASTANPQGTRLSIVLNSLIASGKPVTMVAFGNPYLIRLFPAVAAYLAVYSTVAPSEIAAVKALFGEIAIRGHLPVSIPEIAQAGEGIQTGVK
jgi:beta-N-acetylhexosaminidase